MYHPNLLLIRGLPVTSADYSQNCNLNGRVTHLLLQLDRIPPSNIFLPKDATTGRGVGFGFVFCSSEELALKIIKNYDGYDEEGCVIKV